MIIEDLQSAVRVAYLANKQNKPFAEYAAASAMNVALQHQVYDLANILSMLTPETATQETFDAMNSCIINCQQYGITPLQ